MIYYKIVYWSHTDYTEKELIIFNVIKIKAIWNICLIICYTFWLSIIKLNFYQKKFKQIRSDIEI